MRPIEFACEAVLAMKPEEISQQLLDLSRWPEFTGYGPLPGIKQAEFETRTDEIVGTRIRVTNRDRSTHTEEIVEWQPSTCLRLRLQGFTPPLSQLATAFDETWSLVPVDGGTKVTRAFTLHPRSVFAKPFLWLISVLLRRAISRHLGQMHRESQAAVNRQPST